MVGGCDGQAEALVRRGGAAGRPAREPPAGRVGVRHPPRPDPRRPRPQGLHRPAALLRPHLRHRQPARPGVAGAAAAVRDPGRNLGRVQHVHAVRRRQVALADGALPPGAATARRPRPGTAWTAFSRKGEIKTVPEAAVAVFMGKEFDSLKGRGGGDEPVRKTPWGEIAWQIGGAKSFAGRRAARAGVHRAEGGRDPGDAAEGPAGADPDGRAPQLRQHLPEEGVRRPAVQLPRLPGGDGPRREERRGRRLHPGVRDWSTPPTTSPTRRASRRCSTGWARRS